jgi:hypothetical protein
MEMGRGNPEMIMKSLDAIIWAEILKRVLALYGMLLKV